MDEFIKKYIDELEQSVTDPRFPSFETHELMRRCINVLGKDLNIDENIFYWNPDFIIEDVKMLIQILEYNLAKKRQLPMSKTAELTKSKIFISHRTADEKIARILARFLVDCGAPRDSIFVSSLPGNDVECEISKEVKENLLSSGLNIVLLSSRYYDSVYCQNEAGIIWFLDVPKVIIGLPEINPQNMQGFLNNENKIRRMNNKDDMLYLAKVIEDKYNLAPITPVKLNGIVDDLIEDYSVAIMNKGKVILSQTVLEPDADGYFLTTVVEERFANSKYRCLRINGLLPINQPYQSNETHWLFFDSSLYKDLKSGSTIKFRPSSIQGLRDFNDIKNTRNIYIKNLKIL